MLVRLKRYTKIKLQWDNERKNKSTISLKFILKVRLKEYNYLLIIQTYILLKECWIYKRYLRVKQLKISRV